MKIIDSVLIFIIICILGLSSCEESMSDPNVLSGKLATLIIDQGGVVPKLNYHFLYNDNGVLSEIRNDTASVMKLNFITPDSLMISWFSDGTFFWYDGITLFELDGPYNWLVSLNEQNRLSKIYELVLDSLSLMYKVDYKTDGEVDTIHEPDLFATASEVKNYNYVYSNGNCIEWTYSRYSWIEGQYNTTTYYFLNYSNLPYNKYIPHQYINGYIFQLLHNIGKYLDPFYILGMLDIHSIPPNKNLLDVNPAFGHSYTYCLDSLNRVNEFIILNSSNDNDTLATFNLSYYP